MDILRVHWVLHSRSYQNLVHSHNSTIHIHSPAHRHQHHYTIDRIAASPIRTTSHGPTPTYLNLPCLTGTDEIPAAVTGGRISPVWYTVSHHGYARAIYEASSTNEYHMLRSSRDIVKYTVDRTVPPDNYPKGGEVLARLLSAESLQEAMEEWDPEVVKASVRLLGLDVVPARIGDDPLKPRVHVLQHICHSHKK